MLVASDFAYFCGKPVFASGRSFFEAQNLKPSEYFAFLQRGPEGWTVLDGFSGDRAEVAEQAAELAAARPEDFPQILVPFAFRPLLDQTNEFEEKSSAHPDGSYDSSYQITPALGTVLNQQERMELFVALKMCAEQERGISRWIEVSGSVPTHDLDGNPTGRAFATNSDGGENGSIELTQGIHWLASRAPDDQPFEIRVIAYSAEFYPMMLTEAIAEHLEYQGIEALAEFDTMDD